MLDVNFERRVGEFRLNPVFSAANELAILFGPSGCGKSLTLRAVAGLLRPDSGRIELPGGVVAFDSASETDLPAQQRGTGYVVQELALFPHMSALENIEFGIASWPAQRRRERSAHLISLLGLQGLEHRRPRQMSGGQQQRVAIARALAAEPTLLLLDEPFSALDAALRHTLRREVAALRRRLDVTALFVTHDLTEAYALGDSIVVYDAGAVLQQGPMPEVFRHPASARVAELLETRNLVPGRVEAYVEGVAVVRTPWFTVRVRDPQAPIRGDVFVCIRPEHIIVERAGHASRDQNAVVHTEIVEEMSLGNTHRLFMRTTAIESDLGERYVFEVDVPAHPYEVLNIASRREWRIALANEHVSLVAR